MHPAVLPGAFGTLVGLGAAPAHDREPLPGPVPAALGTRTAADAAITAAATLSAGLWLAGKAPGFAGLLGGLAVGGLGGVTFMSRGDEAKSNGGGFNGGDGVLAPQDRAGATAHAGADAADGAKSDTKADLTAAADGAKTDTKADAADDADGAARPDRSSDAKPAPPEEKQATKAQPDEPAPAASPKPPPPPPAQPPHAGVAALVTLAGKHSEGSTKVVGEPTGATVSFAPSTPESATRFEAFANYLRFGTKLVEKEGGSAPADASEAIKELDASFDRSKARIAKVQLGAQVASRGTGWTWAPAAEAGGAPDVKAGELLVTVADA